MFHSIIIPHRDRLPFLRLCLWSLSRSAETCGVTDYEILVVDDGVGNINQLEWSDNENLNILPVKQDGTFNKSRLLNLGIDQAQGDVLTLLDCDAIVGKRFMEGVNALSVTTKLYYRISPLHRLCYRVRALPAAYLNAIAEAPDRDRYVDGLFARYDSFPRKWEAYGLHDSNRAETDDRSVQPWGNSQWSIRRETLGDIRHDERYVGHGLEDLDILCQCEARWGKDYRAAIFKDADHAMFHIDSRHVAGWRTCERTNENCKMYREKRRALLEVCQSCGKPLQARSIGGGRCDECRTNRESHP